MESSRLSYLFTPRMLEPRQLLLLLFLLLLVAACTTPPAEIPAEKQCAVDSDCVPAQCCHPKDAVNKNYAPNCQGLLCTQECVPNTIDCGQGEIKCVERMCTAVME